MSGARQLALLAVGVAASVGALRPANAQIRLGVVAPPPAVSGTAGTAAPTASGSTAGAPPRRIKWVGVEPGPRSGRPPHGGSHGIRPYGYAVYPFWAFAPYREAAAVDRGLDLTYGSDPLTATPAPVVAPVVISGIGAATAPVIERRIGRTKVIEMGAGALAGEAGLAVAVAGDSLLRLTWRADERSVREVSLFTADADRRTIALQTLRAAPFTALLAATPTAAYVGVTIVYENGATTTSLAPYTPPRD